MCPLNSIIIPSIFSGLSWRGEGKEEREGGMEGEGGKDASVKTVHPLALNNLVKGAKNSG